MNRVTQLRRGQAGLFVVVSLTVLFATLGLAVDLGWGYFRRGAAQAAADSAALSAAMYAQNNGYTCGAAGVVCGSTTTCANPPVSPATNDFQVGCLYAQANGFVNGGRQTVSLTGDTTAPPGTSGNTPAYWVKANVSESILALFDGFGTHVSSLGINTSAIAGVTVSPPAGCIYILSTNATNALSLSGSSTATSSCGIFINSNANPALRLTGSSVLHSTQILINGGTYSVGGSSVLSPTPNTSGGPVTDPLSSLAMPSVGSCDYTNYTVTASAHITMNPGVYCGGIRINSSSVVALNPGIYKLNGGGLVVGGSSTLNGTDVLFFNTGQSGYTPTAISIDGSSVINVTGPTSGQYQGILFMQDRNISYAGTNLITGSSSSSYTGTLYFPSTALNYAGSSSGTYTALIAKTLLLTGSSVIRNDPTGSHTGLARKTTSIIF